MALAWEEHKKERPTCSLISEEGGTGQASYGGGGGGYWGGSPTPEAKILSFLPMSLAMAFNLFSPSLNSF